MLKVHGGGPIVGEVLGEGAGSAGGLVADIASHVGMERIPTDNLVNMGRRSPTRLDKRIETLDCESGASKAKRSLRACSQSRSEGE